MNSQKLWSLARQKANGLRVLEVYREGVFWYATLSDGTTIKLAKTDAPRQVKTYSRRIFA